MMLAYLERLFDISSDVLLQCLLTSMNPWTISATVFPLRYPMNSVRINGYRHGFQLCVNLVTSDDDDSNGISQSIPRYTKLHMCH